MTGCAPCKQAGDNEEATRMVTWSTPGSPMISACDTCALNLAALQLADWKDITILPIDKPFTFDDEDEYV